MKNRKYEVDRNNIDKSDAIDKEIYKENKGQSTTLNANGVFDMRGTSSECVAAYINNEHGNLKKYGGEGENDLYGSTKEIQSKSTKYKEVYESVNDLRTDYENMIKYKGNALYEIAGTYDEKYSLVIAWLKNTMEFPNYEEPFFDRGRKF